MTGNATDQLERIADRLIENVAFFKGLKKVEMFDFLSKADRAILRRGEAVFREGDSAEPALFVIIKGSVDVMKTMPDGTEDTVGTLAVGECFGEMALVDNQPRSATVLAREDCICLKCTRTGVANFQNIAFKLYENLARIIAERYLDMEKQLKLQLKPMCRDVCVAEITKDMPNVAAEIGPRSLLTLSEIGEPYNVPAHGVVVKENAYGQNMYIVLEGELEVRRTVGRETTVLAVLSCGNYFGETALVSVDHGRSADVVAAMDTRLVRLNANHLQKHPDLGALVYRELAKIFSIRLRRSTQVFMRTVGRNCHEDCELLGC